MRIITAMLIALALWLNMANADAPSFEEVQRAAEQGDSVSQFNLGWMYANGESVPLNHTQAFKWFRLAAEQGNADAQFTLGVMYAEGEGVPENDAEAVKWFRLAAEQGNVDAHAMLGAMYFMGEGVEADYVQSYLWFNLAAAQGHPIARSGKEAIEKKMTPEQIAEAQKLSAEWKPKN